MPENLSVPMPGKEPLGSDSPSSCVLSGQLRQGIKTILETMPGDAANWPVADRRELGIRLSDLANQLRHIGAGHSRWKPVLELATSLGQLSPNGAFPPPPRGPLLERIKAILRELAMDQGVFQEVRPEPNPEKPDITYTQMLLRKLGSH